MCYYIIEHNKNYVFLKGGIVMSDFLRWLYAHYIRPYLDALPQEDYVYDFELMQNEMISSSVESFEKSREFTAIHAFLLGLRTGRGLPRD